MPTRSRPPRSSHDFGDDDPTIVEDPSVREFEAVTPVEVPRCVECGAVVFDDDFDDMALAFGLDRCARSRPGVANPWHWCSNYSPTHRKYVQLVPR